MRQCAVLDRPLPRQFTELASVGARHVAQFGGNISCKENEVIAPNGVDVSPQQQAA